MKIYIDLDKIRTIKGEAGDCGVTSLAIAAGVPYKEAWQVLRNLGRYKGDGVNVSMLSMAAKALNFDSKAFYALGKVTLGQFVKIHSKGKFIAFTGNHAMAVVDGRVYDSNMTRFNTKIQGFISL